MILVTPKQEMERKSELFGGVKFFRSNFEVEWESGVWRKIRFLFSGFLWFFFTCGNFTLIFTAFSIFCIWFFFRNVFPNSLIVRSRSSFFSQWKFFELYVRTCPAVFLIRLTDFCFVLPWLLGIDFFNDFSDFYCFAVKICVRDVISAVRSIAWLTSLKKWLWTHLWNFKFYEHLLIKGQ